jgi:glycine cleavage system H protein
MLIPADRRYSTNHQWARAENDGSIAVGITDFAQEALGDVVFVERPATGRILRMGEQCGVVESVKSASDIYAPVSGEVIETNAVLDTAAELINKSAYETWIFKVRPANAAELGSLLDADAYQTLIGIPAG